MSDPATVVDQSLLRQTLAVVMQHVAPVLDSQRFCLVGTAAAAIRGVPLPMHDIDFLMKERRDVDAFMAALSSFRCLTPPAVLHAGMQYYAACEVGGIQVDTSTIEVDTDADCVEVSGAGPWKYRSLIDCGGHAVPVVALELRLATELLRKRPERYGPIVAWMRANGFDRELLVRAMAARGIPQDTQGSTLEQLG